jgi:translation initiation factor 2 subunit 3
MATMLSGAAIMDAVVLVISATEPVPMPQTREHLAAMNIIDMERLIVVQNKIELVTEEEAIQNFSDIQKFIDSEWKGDASKVPIIPISAIHKTNLDIVIQKIEEKFKTPHRDPDIAPFMLIARSFDINKPGMTPDEMSGGVVGGSISFGSLEVGMDVEIRPGVNVAGKWRPILTKISSLQAGFGPLEKAMPGGLIGVGTELDPSMTKNDRLVGHVLGKPGELPPVYDKITFDGTFLDRVVGVKDDQKVPQLPKGAKIMINIGTAKTVGTVDKSSQKGNQGRFSVDLILPVCAAINTRLAISVLIDRRWRLIGYGNLIEGSPIVE